MGKNQNTFEKRRREIEKKQRAEEKRKRRDDVKKDIADGTHTPRTEPAEDDDSGYF